MGLYCVKSGLNFLMVNVIEINSTSFFKHSCLVIWTVRGQTDNAVSQWCNVIFLGACYGCLSLFMRYFGVILKWLSWYWVSARTFKVILVLSCCILLWCILLILRNQYYRVMWYSLSFIEHDWKFSSWYWLCWSFLQWRRIVKDE